MSLVVDTTLSAFVAEVGAADPVAVVGGRTRWTAGGPLADGARLVRAPAGVVEYHPEEMTVTVRAGTPVAELHAALAAAGQRTSLPERGGTVGGAFAVGENHLEVLGRGPLRAAALQVRYVSAEGRLVTGGGPTVKNVTGFDLPRLLVGSLGTLGLLAEVILRTNPIPPESRWVASGDADPFAVRDLLARPGAVLWDGATTWALLEGHPGDVDAQLGVLAGTGRWEPVAGPPALPPHRWSLRPSELRRLAPAGPSGAPEAGAAGEFATGDFVASVGVGTVFATIPQPRRTLSPAQQTLARRVKEQFDPAGRLNPGRRPEVR